MTITQKKTDTLLDEILKGCRAPQDILGEHCLLKQLTKRMIERTLEAEMSALSTQNDLSRAKIACTRLERQLNHLNRSMNPRDIWKNLRGTIRSQVNT